MGSECRGTTKMSDWDISHPTGIFYTTGVEYILHDTCTSPASGHSY